ncbi:polyprenyl synthetase family protein [Actinocorallia longicatena]|uniref:Family 2 encapsulin nanocompartment cargo protein polyprenyl transferase n=1 Tax=Actinocorallia longicatena TaxID=111803 RepID=A0ABP6Q1F6_9ACTN
MTLNTVSCSLGVTDLLAESRLWMEPAMRSAVARLHDGPRTISGFAFGWPEQEGPTGAGKGSSGGGKGIRPAIAGLAARAAGGKAEDAAPGAVAVEFVHAFSLIHDDIMDGDETRRHRTTAWKAFGTGPAILAGDGLLALALDTLAHATKGSSITRLTRTLIDLVNGQAMDTAFESRPWAGPDAVTADEYCAMAVAKTGSLLGCATAVGWLLGGGDEEGAERMDLIGRHLGLAFQAIDDVLGIWGDPAVTGKPVHNDLRQGKKTLPVVAALVNGAPGLALRLAARPSGGREARRTADLIESYGGRLHTEALAERELNAALSLITALPSPATADLELLARYLVTRRS